MDGAVTVFAEGLGPDYVTEPDLRAIIGANRPEAAVLAAVVDGEVAGAATVDRADAVLVARVQATAAAAGHPLDDLGTRRVGHLRSIAVRPAFRRRGIASALNARRLEILRDAGCTAAVSLAWLSGARDNSVGLLRAAGLVPVGTIPDAWRADPAGGGPQCPVCGVDCRCTAEVHVALW